MSLRWNMQIANFSLKLRHEYLGGHTTLRPVKKKPASPTNTLCSYLTLTFLGIIRKMSSKYSALPDIDTQQDVYETPDSPDETEVSDDGVS
ncbi:hypothetical protein C1645_20101 [Glomus cerebriforme]|uniref:Uncharacterized protein n=1 Tax=Glomus cerebriforme TaxID=658196 RepID=A0A397T8N1_9GLOM|nr:hypothetical protein C1645_20101 [Glomus cerebriforme]